MSQRDQIKMSPEEVRAFLESERIVTVATYGPDGRVHLAPMFFGFIDGCIAFTTYGGSQKVRNIERDPRVTLLVEGGTEYEELRGVEIVGRAELIDDYEQTVEMGTSIRVRYYGDANAGPQYGDLRKRTVIKVVPEKVVSWDHRKLHAAAS